MKKKRILMSVLGVAACGISVGMFKHAALGVSTYDAVSLIWSEKQNRLRFPYCRIICDCVCVLLGALLCRAGGVKQSGVVGIGTVITAFFMGPLIAFFNRKVAGPFLERPARFPEKSGRV